MLFPWFSSSWAHLFLSLSFLSLTACTVSPETSVGVSPSTAEAESQHWYSAQDALKRLQSQLQDWDAQALLYEIQGQWVTQSGLSEDWQVTFISNSKQEALSLSLKGGRVPVPLSEEMQNFVAKAPTWPESWPDSGAVAMALSQSPGYTFPMALMRYSVREQNDSLHFDWLIQSELDSLYFQELYTHKTNTIESAS